MTNYRIILQKIESGKNNARLQVVEIQITNQLINRNMWWEYMRETGKRLNSIERLFTPNRQPEFLELIKSVF